MHGALNIMIQSSLGDSKLTALHSSGNLNMSL